MAKLLTVWNSRRLACLMAIQFHWSLCLHVLSITFSKARFCLSLSVPTSSIWDVLFVFACDGNLLLFESVLLLVLFVTVLFMWFCSSSCAFWPDSSQGVEASAF